MKFRSSSAILNRHVCVDFNNLFYKAFYINRKEQAEFDINPIVASFFKLLNSWIREMPYEALKIGMFLDGRPTRRIAAYPEYKAHRQLASDTKQEMNSARKLIVSIMTGLDLDIYQSADHEADDLIASYVRANQGDMITVISDDKDFFQLLVYPGVVIYRPGEKNGVRFIDAYRAQDLLAATSGEDRLPIPPNQIRLYKSLVGDPSDNIKGVARLLKKHAYVLSCAQTPDELPTWIDKLPESSASKVRESMPMIRKNFDIIGFDDAIDLSSCTLQKLGPSHTTEVLSSYPRLKFMDLRFLGYSTRAANTTPDFLSDI